MKGILFFLVAILFITASAFSFCFDEAGARYGINPDLLRAIAEVESRCNPRAFNQNGDGSYDFGVMQINSRWYTVLGHETWIGLSDPCFNVHVGAWILKGCIDRFGCTWEAVGCYNASSKEKRRQYAWKVYDALKRRRQ